MTRSSSVLLSRRNALLAGGLVLAGWALPRHARTAGDAADSVTVVCAQSDTLGTDVGFEPTGLYVEPGTKVRWVVQSNVHTVTAYHPRNGNHSLRIPSAAEPFDSGFLVNPGSVFERRFTVEGVYDYFCLPHEAAGMVGRIVVGRPGGPGLLPFDYFENLPQARQWLPVPAAAQAAFPPVDEILRDRIVHRRPGLGHCGHA